MWLAIIIKNKRSPIADMCYRILVLLFCLCLWLFSPKSANLLCFPILFFTIRRTWLSFWYSRTKLEYILSRICFISFFFFDFCVCTVVVVLYIFLSPPLLRNICRLCPLIYKVLVLQCIVLTMIRYYLFITQIWVWRGLNEFCASQ